MSKKSKSIAIKCSYVKMVPLDELSPHPKNPNQHTKEQIERLAKIIEYQGFRNPVKVSTASGYITAGHGRLEAAKLLGMKEVPVDYQHYEDEAQEYADLVADNAIAEWSSLDLSSINTDIGDLGPDFDVEFLGLMNFEVVAADKFDEEAQDEVPEPPKEPKTVLGDLYEFGNHRLLCGDSTSIDAVEKLMDGKKADMVFTDPPYNIASESKNHAKDVSKAMNDLANAEWDKEFEIEPALSTIMTVCADSVTIYVWTSHFLIQKIWDQLNTWCDFTNYCVWEKPNPMPSLSKRHWTWSTELCVYATRGSKRKVNFPDGEHASNVWNFVKKSDGTHPTQKPVELCEHPIKFSSDPNQNILDVFGGSGSTLIACEKTNRSCFMMELDPKYCDVIVSRWCKVTGQTKVKRNGVEMEWDSGV